MDQRFVATRAQRGMREPCITPQNRLPREVPYCGVTVRQGECRLATEHPPEGSHQDQGLGKSLKEEEYLA